MPCGCGCSASHLISAVLILANLHSRSAASARRKKLETHAFVVSSNLSVCWASRAEEHAKNCLLNAKSKVFAVRFVSCCARRKRSSAKVSEWPFQTSAHWPNQIHECLFVIFYCTTRRPFSFGQGKPNSISNANLFQWQHYSFNCAYAILDSFY